MALTKADVGKIQRRVLGWFDEHGRSFPWREHRDPYQTMVAEVMLQQTQTGRVAPAYGEFLKRFPTLDRLAHAPAMEVIRAWKGLGYNRRAVDLQRTAQVVAHDHGGAFPDDPKVLRKMPGIGEYSAGAIACFAFDAQVPVIDVNVRRVLARVARGVEDDRIDKATVQRIATEWLPSGEAYRWNQALMDVGAMLCRAEKPLCAKCPMKTWCRYYTTGKHRSARAKRAPKAEPFEGSRRQKRGGIVDHLRRAARRGLSLADLAKAIHPDGDDRDLAWLVDLLDGLERDGLVQLTPGARKASPRGLVRLPG